MKPARVSRILSCPDPTANNVPDAHAPPICMPIPKMNEPRISPRPIGAPAGAGMEPNSPVLVPIRMAARVAVVPSSNAWARNPAPLPTATSWRHAEVNPKREWKSANPSPRPSPSRVAFCAPCADPTNHNKTAATTANTASGPTWTGPASAGEGRGAQVGAALSRFVLRAGETSVIVAIVELQTSVLTSTTLSAGARPGIPVQMVDSRSVAARGFVAHATGA